MKKELKELKAGDVVTMDLPCKVVITKITPQEGNEFKGNNRVEYEFVERIAQPEPEGADIGSLVALEVWE